MSDIKIHVLHTGKVCVAPDLPFGGEGTSLLKASGLFTKKSDRIWLPVSAYLVETPHGLFLFDTGWSRTMSPEGVFDKKAQVRSLGSSLLYHVNQGVLPKGQAVDEQMARMGVEPADLDCVLLSHLDCDHANGLSQVKEAKHFLVSDDELAAAKKDRSPRYQSVWWDGVGLETFDWNDDQGPFGRSYDVTGDGMLEMVAIPGHSEGLCALKATAADGRYALLFSDGGYATKSWRDMVLPGIAVDRDKQRASLEWIREQSTDPKCVESLANHDPDVKPHVIEL